MFWCDENRMRNFIDIIHFTFLPASAYYRYISKKKSRLTKARRKQWFATQQLQSTSSIIEARALLGLSQIDFYMSSIAEEHCQVCNPTMCTFPATLFECFHILKIHCKICTWRRLNSFDCTLTKVVHIKERDTTELANGGTKYEWKSEHIPWSTKAQLFEYQP